MYLLPQRQDNGAAEKDRPVTPMRPRSNLHRHYRCAAVAVSRAKVERTCHSRAYMYLRGVVRMFWPAEIPLVSLIPTAVVSQCPSHAFRDGQNGLVSALTPHPVCMRAYRTARVARLNRLNAYGCRNRIFQNTTFDHETTAFSISGTMDLDDLLIMACRNPLMLVSKFGCIAF